jgi:hypothetical protein
LHSIASLAMASLPPQRSYQNTLVSLLSFLDGQKYHKNTVFPSERLGAIMAEDLLRWMKYKTFGTPFPGLDANPTGCRSSTILFWKKSISFFIPNKHHPWDSLTERGNPTLQRYTGSRQVHQEERSLPSRGSLSSEKAIDPGRVQECCTSPQDWTRRRRASGEVWLAFQFHLITRIDCVGQLQ